MTKRRLLPFPAVPNQPSAPMSELNTTPLIDVMLVLLVMFIITVPAMTHKVAVDLPQPGPTQPVEPRLYHLNLDAAGAISLNGQPLTLADLRPTLEAIRNEPGSTVLLRTDGETPYDRFDHVMATVKRAGITRLGMSGNERFVPALN
jgi:biopolymer transport protein ExbD